MSTHLGNLGYRDSCTRCMELQSEIDRLKTSKLKPKMSQRMNDWWRGLLVASGIGVVILCLTKGATLLGWYIGTNLFGFHMHEGWKDPPGRLDSWLLGIGAILLLPITIKLIRLIPFLGKLSREWWR